MQCYSSLRAALRKGDIDIQTRVAWQWAHTKAVKERRHVGLSAQHHLCSGAFTKSVASEGLCGFCVFFFLRDSGMALADTSVVQVEGLTFRDEHTGLLWTVQSGTPTCLELICSAYMGRVLFPISPHCLLLPTEENQRMTMGGEFQKFWVFLCNMLGALELSFLLGNRPSPETSGAVYDIAGLKSGVDSNAF